MIFGIQKEIVYILQGYEFIGFNGLDEIIDDPIKENSIKNLSLKLPDEYKGRKNGKLAIQNYI